MSRESVRVSARHAEIGPALDRIDDCLARDGVEADVRHDVRLAAEEALVNIARHAAAENTPSVDIRLDSDDEAVRLELRDDGPPFDPLSQPPPDFSTPPADRPSGGLGIYLMRRVTDEASYRRIGEFNVLRLVRLRPAREREHPCR